MKELHHDNVNAFIGVCLEVPHANVLMAYASHGSLQDAIAAGDTELTWDFKISILTDIAQGMVAVQSYFPGLLRNLFNYNNVVALVFKKNHDIPQCLSLGFPYILLFTDIFMHSNTSLYNYPTLSQMLTV